MKKTKRVFTVYINNELKELEYNIEHNGQVSHISEDNVKLDIKREFNTDNIIFIHTQDFTYGRD